MSDVQALCQGLVNQSKTRQSASLAGVGDGHINQHDSVG